MIRVSQAFSLRLTVQLLLPLAMLAMLNLGGCASNGRKSMDRGKQYMAQKDYSRALIEFRNAYRHFPKDPEVVYQMALAYLANNDLADGVGALRLATQIDPKHVNAQLKLSELMALNSREDIVQEAQRRAQAALAVDTTNAEAMATLAFAELRLGQADVAEKRLEDAIAASPKTLKPSLVLANLRLSQKDVAGAETILKTAQQANPKSWEAWFALERFYMLTNRPNDAEAAAAQVLSIDPTNELSLLDLAALKMALQKPAEAEDLYKRIAAHQSKKYRTAHAIFLYRQGKQAEGISELEKLHADNKIDRTIRNQLVAAYLSVNRGADAEKVLDQAIKTNSHDSDALLQRSEIRLVQGKVDGIEGDLAEVLKFKPDSGEAHYLMARLHRLRNSPANEERELYEALKLNPKLIMARIDVARRLLARKGAKAALDLLDAAPEEQKRQVTLLAQRNWTLLALGRYDDLRVGIDSGYQISRTPDLLLQDAVLHFKSKQFPAGRALLAEALKQNPNDTRALQTLAESYIVESKDLNKALGELKAYAAANPKSPRVQHLYGNWLSAAGKPAEGRTAFEAAKAADPKYIGADLALAQIDLAQGQYDQARQELTNVLKSQADNPSATMLMAMLDEKAGRTQQSIESYLKILKMEPENGIALNNLAYQLTKNPAKTDEALQYAQKAKSVVPANPAFDDTLGWAYYQKGLFPSAVKQLEVATAGPNPTPVRLYHLAMAYQKAGNPAKAKLTFDKAQKISPTIPEAELARQVVGGR